MRKLLRDLTLHALAIASLLIAPPSSFAAPQPESHRAIITRAQPIYPELARRMGITGTVTIRALVLPNGTVSEVHTEAGHALLRLAAEQAVRRWRFVANSESSECVILVVFELPN